MKQSTALQMMFLKYQLPSEPNVYVDLLDDEDVSLMFDEVGTSPPPCAAVRRHSRTVICQKCPRYSVIHKVAHPIGVNSSRT